MKSENVLTLLKFLAEQDMCDSDVSWTTDLHFFVNCSDFFSWGTADAEELRDEDLKLFMDCITDSRWESYHGSLYGEQLYCARKVGMRPQGAVYTYIPKEYWYMFDECGPEREVNFGNPYQPGEYKK